MQRAFWGLIAILASAVMFVLALPPADLAPFGFFCFTPILVAFRGKGFAWGFFAGVAALILGALVCWGGWLYTPSLMNATPDWNFAAFGLFGIVVGLSCAIIGEIKNPPSWLPWALAAWAVLFESLLLVYIPAHIALTQYRMFPAMKLASIGGIWAVSYVVWLLNFLLAQGYVARNKKAMATCGAFLGLYFGLNAFTGFPRAGELKVAMLQTETQVLDVLAVYNKDATGNGAKIVVWPELAGQASAPFGNTDQLRELAALPDQAAFVTSFEDGNELMPYNAAAIFSNEGESERYRKRKLFGGEGNYHLRGTKPASAKVGGITYGLNICFDSCFPLIMRDTAMLDDVSIVLLPTLDPIGPYGTVQAFHAAYTPFRAAEMGVPIVRTDTTAYSMVVDSRGVIVAQMGSGFEGVLVAEVTPERRDTLYRRLGDWFLILCGFIVVAGLIKGRTAAPRREPSSLKKRRK